MTEKPDYEAMWKELTDKPLPREFKELTDAIEKKHTPKWKPEVGEWCWDKERNMPVRILTWWTCYDSYNTDQGAQDLINLEPLDRYLPIQEYKGFKVGEKVQHRGLIWNLISLQFHDGEEAQAVIERESGNGGYDGVMLSLSKIEHLSPEPKKEVLENLEYTILPEVVHVEDLVDGESIDLTLEDLELLMKFKDRLERKGE